MKIRAHHLLCMQLFEGKGYSETFCEGMAHVIKELQMDKKGFTLEKASDDICNHCPNKVNETDCCLGNEDVENRDKNVMTILHLQENELLTYESIKNDLKSKIDEKHFIDLCGDCRWYKKKICTYEKWRSSFKE